MDLSLSPSSRHASSLSPSPSSPSSPSPSSPLDSTHSSSSPQPHLFSRVSPACLHGDATPTLSSFDVSFMRHTSNIKLELTVAQHGEKTGNGVNESYSYRQWWRPFPNFITHTQTLWKSRNLITFPIATAALYNLLDKDTASVCVSLELNMICKNQNLPFSHRDTLNRLCSLQVRVFT